VEESKAEVVEKATQTEEIKEEKAKQVEYLDVIMGEDSSPFKVKVEDTAPVTALSVTKKQVK